MQKVELKNTFNTNRAILQALLEQVTNLADQLEQAAQLVAGALLTGNKLMCCGNGGSAADAAHFSSEIAGRYKIERPGFPAIDLTAEHTLITALSNDYPPQEVFARQVNALGRQGDVLAVFTTSGNSENIRLALQAARTRSIKTIAFLGKGGGKCKGLADVELIVPSDVTARIQEVHLHMYHTICEVLDPILADHTATTIY